MRPLGVLCLYDAVFALLCSSVGAYEGLVVKCDSQSHATLRVRCQEDAVFAVIVVIFDQVLESVLCG